MQGATVIHWERFCVIYLSCSHYQPFTMKKQLVFIAVSLVLGLAAHAQTTPAPAKKTPPASQPRKPAAKPAGKAPTTAGTSTIKDTAKFNRKFQRSSQPSRMPIRTPVRE
jgi:hypothetical protein